MGQYNSKVQTLSGEAKYAENATVLIRRLPHRSQFLFAPVPPQEVSKPRFPPWHGKSHESAATLTGACGWVTGEVSSRAGDTRRQRAKNHHPQGPCPSPIDVPDSPKGPGVRNPLSDSILVVWVISYPRGCACKLPGLRPSPLRLGWCALDLHCAPFRVSLLAALLSSLAVVGFPLFCLSLFSRQGDDRRGCIPLRPRKLANTGRIRRCTSPPPT